MTSFFFYTRVLLALVASLVASLLLFSDAASAYELDRSFNPRITGNSFTDRRVNVAVEQADGKMLIGGNFSNVNGVVRRGLVRLESDGDIDTSFTANISPRSPGIEGVIVQDDGKIIVIGEFDTVDGITRNGLARLNQDGTLDESYRLQLRFFDIIRSFEALENGQLLLVLPALAGSPEGVFSRIVRYNSDGSRDPSFNTSVGGGVSGMEEQSDGRILIIGSPETINGSNVERMARLNTDGSLDTSFDAPVTNLPINAIAVHPDKSIFIGGLFTRIDGIRQPRMARLSENGTLDMSFTPDINNGATSFLFLENGNVLVGGNFNQVDGMPVRGIALLNDDGRLDSSSNIISNGTVTNISLQRNGDLIINGFITRINDVQRDGVARLCLICEMEQNTTPIPAIFELLLEE